MQLFQKCSNLYAEILAATFPIYILVDTNWNASVESHEFLPELFNIFRCDRTELTSHKATHGGVLIPIDKQIKSELVLHGESSGYEQLWLKLSLDQRKERYTFLQIRFRNHDLLFINYNE